MSGATQAGSRQKGAPGRRPLNAASAGGDDDDDDDEAFQAPRKPLRGIPQAGARRGRGVKGPSKKKPRLRRDDAPAAPSAAKSPQTLAAPAPPAGRRRDGDVDVDDASAIASRARAPQRGPGVACSREGSGTADDDDEEEERRCGPPAAMRTGDSSERRGSPVPVASAPVSGPSPSHRPPPLLPASSASSTRSLFTRAAAAERLPPTEPAPSDPTKHQHQHQHQHLPACPVCGLCLRDLAETETGWQAHVNGCIDRAALQGEAPQLGMEQAGKGGGGGLDNGEPEEEEGEEGEDVGGLSEPEELTQMHRDDADDRLAKWLAERGLLEHLGRFAEEEVDLGALPHLSDADLQGLGVADASQRKVLLREAALLGGAQRGAAHPQAPSLRAERPGAASRAFLALFNRGRQARPATPPPAPRRPPSAWGRRTQGREQMKRAPRGAGAGADHRLVPGTPFVVDGFTRDLCHLPCRSWFLTHFHSDHYQGLGATFRRGAVYCTPITAALVRQELRVSPSALRRAELRSPIEVEGCRVTFLEANHCPGAAMILFEPPGAQPVLQTGDCRCCPSMQQEPALEAVRGRVHLVLDATYARSACDFPPQEDTIRFVADAIRSESFNPGVLILIGTYKIGKERLFLEVARRLERKVYVSETKMRVLRCLSLPPEQLEWLTTDDRQTNLHAVPMNKVTVNGINTTMKWYKGRYKTVVAFKPTGWSMERGKSKCKGGRRQRRGTVVTYQVPYSEHSSFRELKDFVSWLRPSKLTLHSFSGGSERDVVQELLWGGTGCVDDDAPGGEFRSTQEGPAQG